MEHHPLNVLLLGWDEAAQASDPAAPTALELSRHLTEHLPVSVIVPWLADAATLTAADQIIRLNLLSAAQLATTAIARFTAVAGTWQAPAAPYAGASTQPGAVLPVAPAAPTTQPAARAGAASAPATAGAAAPAAPGLLNEDEFAEATAEVGPDEAADTHQPADNLTLESPAEETAPTAATAPAGNQPVAATPATEKAAAQAAFVQALESLDGSAEVHDLNFRVIQYARFATPLAVSQPFGVVYATSWPAWLAALEIRQLTGRPLVLHVQSLAVDRDSPADRGWILALERLALRRADLILAHTEELAQRLTSAYSLPAARIRVIDANDTAAINDALTHVTPRA